VRILPPPRDRLARPAGESPRPQRLAAGWRARLIRVAYPLRCGPPCARQTPRKVQQVAAAPHHRTAFRGASSGEDLMSMIQYLNSLARNEEGQDLLEYALLVALIALVAIIAVTAAGGSVATIFNNIATALNGAA
jgi:pilus assembly protein Flp/PilA